MPKIQLNGNNISLNKNDFLAQGGEGSVYKKGTVAFKIYNEPNRMIPFGKMVELSVLKLQNIIKPEEVFYSGNKAVGYTMRYVPNTISLCSTFTKAFKDRNLVTPEKSFDLVKNMRETVDYIHKNNILIVDLNEMNFLTDKKLSEVYFIDVDSYQTQSYKATALMESVRDRHSNGFNIGTDWFSFAIVSFQMMVGIHPYKGKHPQLKGFDARMQNNISVFHNDVSVPKSCLSFDVIPEVWRNWYRAVFNKGYRSCPPIEGQVLHDIVTIVQIIEGSNNFSISELFECGWDIINYEPNFGNECTVCTNGFRLKGGIHIENDAKAIGYYQSTPIAASVENEVIKFFNIKQKTPIDAFDISATEVMSISGRLYAKQQDKIIEVEFVGPEYRPNVAANVVGNVMENSTQLFSGVAIQNVLGTYYASVFFDKGMCVQSKLEGLDKKRIVNAKYYNGVLVLIVAEKGKYERYIYSVNSNGLSQPRVVDDIQSIDINFTVLDKGICVLITDEEVVEIFSNKNVSKLKEIKDDIIHGGMRLFHNGDTVLFADGKKMFKMKMK